MTYTTKDFQPGEKVIYSPNYIDSFGREERGRVSSTNDMFVFVKYGRSKTTQATRPEDLKKVAIYERADHEKESKQ